MANTLPERYARWLRSNVGLEPRVPDFDLMDTTAVRDWLKAVPHKRAITTVAEARFPGRPPGFLVAYRLLLTIAHFKLRGKSYESHYRRLPVWARWRDYLPVDACVLPGKKFRKHPPKTNPIDLLKYERKAR